MGSTMTYRIALSYRSAKALLEMQNWRALLEKDQLRIEQRRGRVFQGWNEGKGRYTFRQRV
ncbi:putative Endonuclease/exonuclease/phosphatase superfamily [Helianthus annuus]|nr:putative Endonuclease/exonuclease/phosphatase superfamily [Helianthus annuus]